MLTDLVLLNEVAGSVVNWHSIIFLLHILYPYYHYF